MAVVVVANPRPLLRVRSQKGARPTRARAPGTPQNPHRQTDAHATAHTTKHRYAPTRAPSTSARPPPLAASADVVACAPTSRAPSWHHAPAHAVLQRALYLPYSSSCPHQLTRHLLLTHAHLRFAARRHITGLVSPGLCGAGCAVQGGEEAGCEEGALRWSVRRQRRSAPCAWRAAVVLPRIRAEMMGENYWVPPHSPAQAASCSARGAQRREPDAMEERALRTPSPQLLRGAVWWWGVAMAVGSAPERGDGGEGATSAR